MDKLNIELNEILSKIGLSGLQLDLALDDIITNDSETISTKKWAAKLASEMINVLIIGETGTGKELFAKVLHGNRTGNFISVNCGGIPESLLESEFFGSEKGSYTGSSKTRKGYFEQAKDGTIFLDEIAELDRNLQSKLLRVIQEKKIKKIGSDEEIVINCRIISATNVTAETLESNNKIFRQDLYYRLAGTTLKLKPLRERKNDIELIWNTIFEKRYKINDYPKIHSIISDKETFPGNIRQLINIIEETKIMLRHKMLPL